MFTKVKHLLRRQAAVGAALSVLLSCFPLAPAAALDFSGVFSGFLEGPNLLILRSRSQITCHFVQFQPTLICNFVMIRYTGTAATVLWGRCKTYPKYPPLHDKRRGEGILFYSFISFTFAVFA